MNNLIFIQHTQLKVNRHVTLRLSAFLTHPAGLPSTLSFSTTMKNNLGRCTTPISHRFTRPSMLSLFSSRSGKVAASLFISCTLSLNTYSVSGFTRPTTTTFSKHSSSSFSSLNMAEQHLLANHNFSGPRVEKKDAGLPTLIVFDLDGKLQSQSQLRHGTNDLSHVVLKIQIQNKF
jgi:hypothetical protein